MCLLSLVNQHLCPYDLLSVLLLGTLACTINQIMVNLIEFTKSFTRFSFFRNGPWRNTDRTLLICRYIFGLRTKLVEVSPGFCQSISCQMFWWEFRPLIAFNFRCEAWKTKTVEPDPACGSGYDLWSAIWWEWCQKNLECSSFPNMCITHYVPCPSWVRKNMTLTECSQFWLNCNF